MENTLQCLSVAPPVTIAKKMEEERLGRQHSIMVRTPRPGSKFSTVVLVEVRKKKRESRIREKGSDRVKFSI